MLQRCTITARCIGSPRGSGTSVGPLHLSGAFSTSCGLTRRSIVGSFFCSPHLSHWTLCDGDAVNASVSICAWIGEPEPLEESVALITAEMQIYISQHGKSCSAHVPAESKALSKQASGNGRGQASFETNYWIGVGGLNRSQSPSF